MHIRKQLVIKSSGGTSRVTRLSYVLMVLTLIGRHEPHEPHWLLPFHRMLRREPIQPPKSEFSQLWQIVDQSISPRWIADFCYELPCKRACIND